MVTRWLTSRLKAREQHDTIGYYILLTPRQGLVNSMIRFAGRCPTLLLDGLSALDLKTSRWCNGIPRGQDGPSSGSPDGAKPGKNRHPGSRTGQTGTKTGLQGVQTGQTGKKMATRDPGRGKRGEERVIRDPGRAISRESAPPGILDGASGEKRDPPEPAPRATTGAGPACPTTRGAAPRPAPRGFPAGRATKTIFKIFK
jgi:hypothetical protein